MSPVPSGRPLCSGSSPGDLGNNPGTRPRGDLSINSCSVTNRAHSSLHSRRAGSGSGRARPGLSPPRGRGCAAGPAPAAVGRPWGGWLLPIGLLQLLGPAGACPCRDPRLCQPVTGPAGSEVFVFDVGKDTWKSYDWSKITTVAAFGKYDPELMCYAHSKGSRIVLKGDVPLKEIVDPAKRAAWISQQLDLAKKQYMDGINIDIEQEVNETSSEYYALTELVKETTEAFHREIAGSQVTFDVAWSPACIDKRCYNYTGIADACDFLFVMSYDEQSQIWTDCIAKANAPYLQTLVGYEEYIAMGIDPKKLVMGVPWYGYDYVCQNLSTDHVCSLPKVPFRGAPCSDAAGSQVPYATIMKQVNSSLSGVLWDELQKAPFYEYKDSVGQFHQVWFDDPRSISLKAAYVKNRGLRGIGMWNGNSLDYSKEAVAEQQTQAMWQALIP